MPVAPQRQTIPPSLIETSPKSVKKEKRNENYYQPGDPLESSNLERKSVSIVSKTRKFSTMKNEPTDIFALNEQGVVIEGFFAGEEKVKRRS